MCRFFNLALINKAHMKKAYMKKGIEWAAGLGDDI
jgi:hypothetical protein